MPCVLNRTSTNSFLFRRKTWLAANAPSLNAASFETTLFVGAMVPVCLRTAAQVCPGGTTPTNTPATGKPGISGTAQVGQTLTATTSGISDTDGKTKAENGDTGYAYTHQWIRVDGSNETDISGETSSTYTPSSFDVGKTIRVRVSFTDDADNAEDPLTSDATAAVTAACSEVWCATLTVRSLTGGARGCAISQAGKECSSNLTEDGFSHGGTDYAVTGLQVLSNGELRLFINPDLTTATRSLVLLVGAERFAFAHADTRAANSRYWNGSGLNWPSGTTVDLKLVEASTIATLSGLELEDGDGAAVALTPGFSSGTTSYLASVANGIDTVTLTVAKNDSNATVVITDDDDTTTPGEAELDLNVGSNTLTVTVTAEDGTTEQEYTITVTRAGATTANLPWSTTMTVGETTGLGRGYRSSGETRPGGSLVTDSFTTGGVPYTVLRLEVSDHQSGVEFKLNSELPSYADLTLEFAGETLPLASATNIGNQKRFHFNDAWLTANAPSLSLANFETTLPVGAMVSACLRTATQVCPGGGTTTTNTAATGQPGISGTPQVGQVLTAGLGDIADGDDLPSSVFPAGYTFQWVQVDSSNNETDVGTDSSTYSPASSDVGSTIKVEVSFTDGGGNAETVTSDETAAVVAAAGPCPAGNDWCTTMTVGVAEQGPFTHAGYAEPAGRGALDDTAIGYGSKSFPVAYLQTSTGLIDQISFGIDDAVEYFPSGSVFNFGGTEFTADASSEQIDVGEYRWDRPANFGWIEGQKVTVSANLAPAPESATVDGTSLVLTHAEDLDTGSTPAAGAYVVKVNGGTGPAVSGVSVGTRTLTLTLATAVTATDIVTVKYDVPTSNRLRDVSGLDAPAFDDFPVTNNTGATNTAATGKPSITGTAEVGRTLTASTSGISDANGKTKAENGDAGYAYTYQWVRVDGTNETDIAGATSDTYRLVQADAGKTFRVKVSFKDNAGNSEGPLTSNEYPVSGAYGDLRLVDDSGPTDDGEGRLEVFFRGEWGTVCDDRFASETFKVYAPLPSTPPPYETRDFDIVRNVAPQLACQLMGHSTGEVVSRGDLGMSVAPASQEIWLDDVRCAEGSTPPKGLHQQCYHAGVGLENCTHEEDVHLRCFGSSTARAAFSGEFQNVPESHDGTEFTFQAAFSEAVTASAEDLRDHAFDVTGGTVTEVSPVDGRRDLWSVTVSPASSEDVTITLDGERACDTPGAVCAEDGEQLTNTVSVEIPGTPVIGDGITARFEDVPPQHDGETPFTLRLALSAPVRNSYTAMREDVLEATGGTVTRARRIDGRSDLWEITITPQGEGNVQLVLAAGRACGTRGALCTRDGRGLATGLMTLVPGPSTIGPRSPGPAPLTARFTNIPGEHDGENRFTLEIVFSEAPSGMKNKTLRNALRVTNGAVTRVRRVNQVLAHRIVTVRPTGHQAVDIELPASQDCEAAGAICTGAGGRLETGLLTRVRGPAALRVADAEVHEGPGAVLAFAVTLDRATSAAVGVDYATSDGTAQAGSDYTAATGSVTFAPGEMAKTVSVAVLDDSHDEGSETLTLRLTNPSGAYIVDAVATGTIENSDHMPKAWIARFGRTVGTQVVDALTQRLDGAGGSHVTVAGINLIGAKGEEPTLTGDDPFGLPEWAKNAEREADAQTITADDLLLRSAFHISSAGNAMQQGGAAFTAWGRVATAGFKAEEDDVTMDGDVTTGLVGFDAEWERGLAGIMLSHSSGDGSYRLDPAKGEDAGTVDSSLTGVYPYARVDLNAKVSAWALAGMGSGELTLRQTGKKPMPTDISMRMGALGVKGQVLDGSGPSGVALNVKSDAMWVGTKSERSGDMIATQGDVMRLRLIIQGERTFEGGSGAAFTPSAEVGLRHDGGDAETGTGVEVGAGLRYSIGSVTIEARARTLLAHEASGYDEWGMSGAIRVTPAASGRGLTLSIAPAWGRTGSAAQRLWSAHDARGLGADNEFEADSRLDMEAGYGFGLPGSRGVLTPHAGMTLGDAGHRAIRTGARWRLSPDAVLGLEGTRQTSDAGEAATEVKLRAALRF